MKPDLGIAYSVSWGGFPAGMAEADFPIWQRFQARFKDDFKSFYFNVRVGEPMRPITELTPEIAKMAEDLTRRRIDVVGEKAGLWWLIEIRPSAGPGAFGQVMMYQTLWNLDPPDERPSIPVLVTDRTDYNVVATAQAQGILLIVV